MTSLAVEQLRLCAARAGGAGSIPDQGTKTPLAAGATQKKTPLLTPPLPHLHTPDNSLFFLYIPMKGSYLTSTYFNRLFTCLLIGCQPLEGRHFVLGIFYFPYHIPVVGFYLFYVIHCPSFCSLQTILFNFFSSSD